MTWHVVVVGGGITGLATANALQEMVRAGRLGTVTLVEASARLGGKILTEQVDGFLIEGGPDSFLTVKPAAVELCHALGLGDRLVGTTAPRDVFVLHRGRLEPLPGGLAMLVPSALGPFLRSGLFSWTEKARFALEPFIPPMMRDGRDASLGEFVRRRLGQAAVDRLAAPLLAGIHAGDVEQLSVRATFPQLVEVEQQYGSLAAAALSRRQRPGRAEQGMTMFATLAGGLQELVTRLAGALEHITARTECAAKEITRAGRRYAVTLADGTQLLADAVIVTVPTWAAAPLLRAVNPEAARAAETIRYTSTAAVALAFRRRDVAHGLTGHGYVVARSERVLHTACTWVSSKWPHRAPPDHVLLRCYAGTAGDQTAVTMDGDALTDALVQELRPLLGISGPPILTRVYRWRHSMPQYLVGHLDRVRMIETALQQTPGIVVAGAGYRGVGLPDCIRQGAEAARRAVASLAKDAREITDGSLDRTSGHAART